jgi:glycosyltransferase involved in cell wall biosynthesis
MSADAVLNPEPSATRAAGAIRASHAAGAAEAASPRVAFLLSDPGIPLYSSVKAGGVHARSMIRAFQAEGAEVDVCVLRTGKGETRLGERVRIHEAGTGAIRRLLSRRFPHDARPNWAAGAEALLIQRDFLKTGTAVLSGAMPPDLIYARHAWLPHALERLGARTRAPLYLEVNALFAQEKLDRGELAFPRLTRWLEGRALRRAERVLPVSESLAGAIREYGVPAERIELMPNGVDPELFDAKLRPPRTSTTNGRWTIGLVSSFRPYHGLGTLVEAARMLDRSVGGVRLLLIGDGPERTAIATQARELGLGTSVDMSGGVAHGEVPGLLAACDVCVAPYEGELNQYNCPMKLYEYMAMKIPIVASAWGEIPRILEDGRTALLHEAGNAEALAAKLRDVHDDTEGAVRRAEAAYEVARTHTWRAHARWILDHAASRKGSRA